MKLHRFFVEAEFSEQRPLKLFEAELISQIRNVLRLRVGDQLILCDGHGKEALCKISEADKEKIEFEIISLSQNSNEPAVEIFLYCSILKRENFEWVAQKATEVGVSHIIPLVSRRTVKLDLRHDRLEKIIKEAAEQSGRGRIPSLEKPLELAQAFTHCRSLPSKFFFEPAFPSFDWKAWKAKDLKKVGLFIGPEGGWETQEVEQAKQQGLEMVGLGSLVLRAETAAVIGSYLLTQM